MALVVLFTAFLVSCKQEKEIKEVIFVCTYGATRSPMAAVYFNKLAKEQNLDFRAVHKGITPDGVLTKETLAGLDADGFDISSLKTEKLTQEDIGNAHTIVKFDCELPYDSENSKVISWNGTPSAVDDYSTAKEVFEKKIETLVTNLKNE